MSTLPYVLISVLGPLLYAGIGGAVVELLDDDTWGFAFIWPLALPVLAGNSLAKRLKARNLPSIPKAIAKNVKK